MNLQDVPLGELCLMEHNKELIQVVYKCFTRCVVRPMNPNAHGEFIERDVAPACPVLPYHGQFNAFTCACGCGRLVSKKRKTKIYATRGCKDRVFRQKAKRDRKPVRIQL